MKHSFPVGSTWEMDFYCSPEKAYCLKEATWRHLSEIGSKESVAQVPFAREFRGLPVAPTGKPTEGGLRLRPPRSEDGTQTLSFHELLVAG
mmetsp:Transcript_25577/g.37784  ORF Transcript_25577/g.37784 Transcript_25577/m.37784 type:complete len:91 (+) Transcript_25577:455-727(+)